MGYFDDLIPKQASERQATPNTPQDRPAPDMVRQGLGARVDSMTRQFPDDERRAEQPRETREMPTPSMDTSGLDAPSLPSDIEQISTPREMTRDEARKKAEGQRPRGLGGDKDDKDDAPKSTASTVDDIYKMFEDEFGDVDFDQANMFEKEVRRLQRENKLTEREALIQAREAMVMEDEMETKGGFLRKERQVPTGERIWTGEFDYGDRDKSDKSDKAEDVTESLNPAPRNASERKEGQVYVAPDGRNVRWLGDKWELVGD